MLFPIILFRIEILDNSFGSDSSLMHDFVRAYGEMSGHQSCKSYSFFVSEIPSHDAYLERHNTAGVHERTQCF